MNRKLVINEQRIVQEIKVEHRYDPYNASGNLEGEMQ